MLNPRHLPGLSRK
jgi:hypothetical protein